MQKSDKINIVDRKIFEKISHNHDGPQRKPIKNCRYKRMREDFNIFNYVIQTTKRHSQKERKKLQQPRLAINKRFQMKVSKKRGKKRENAKKVLTRLKKCILKHRATKLLANIENDDSTECDKPSIPNDFEASIPAQTTSSPALVTATIPPKPPLSKLFSNKFRNYCDNLTTQPLRELTERLLRELNGFQRRAQLKNPIKAAAHRRLVVGLRETDSYLTVNKIKLAIIAPDIEKCPTEGGLDNAIESIKSYCQSHQIPYLFSLRRRDLAYALFKKSPVSCVGILDYDGAREIFAELMIELEKARAAFLERMRLEQEALSAISGLLNSMNLNEAN